MVNLNSNDPSLRSWIKYSSENHFPIQNLPFGIFSTDYLEPGVGVAIGDFILDLTCLQEHGFFEKENLPDGIFNQKSLNLLLKLGRQRVRKVRERLSVLLQEDSSELRDHSIVREMALIPMEEATLHLPVEIGDYTDFYSSIEHATNVGKMFRDPENALLPNWKHLPVGYHGRSGSIVVSGTDIVRPKGQFKSEDQPHPVFGSSQRLDFELEMAFITCSDSKLGTSISVDKAEDHIFGLVLFNDWSARDIQAWEYVPLGPFLGKNFASTMSPWIVTLDALEPFRVQGPMQDPPVLPYLKLEQPGNFDIHLEAYLSSSDGVSSRICQTNYAYMYWSMAQQLAHHTVNGCNIRVGDLCASGTISGKEQGSFGSMLELAWKGTKPITLENGEKRSFLKDKDTLSITGWAQGKGYRVGFGEAKGQILPSAT